MNNRLYADTQYNHIIADIIARGNDVEIRSCKDGKKIVEVRKTVIAVIPDATKPQRKE